MKDDGGKVPSDNADGAPTLVTFALLAYNQERFIREAVEAALAQTYSPLEIVISDDCSTDRTFDVIQDVVREYRGPHRIVLNRNAKNLGIGGHVARVADYISGDPIVVAAGDDVSDIQRVAKIAAAFKVNPKLFAAFSDVILVDQGGAQVADPPEKTRDFGRLDALSLAAACGGKGLGATYAYRKRVFHWPYNYPVHLRNEDRILPFRASLIGEVICISETLVRYRLSAQGVSRALSPSELLANYSVDHLKELLKTVDAARDAGMIPARYASRLRCLVVALIAKRHLLVAAMGNGLPARVAKKGLPLMNFLIYRVLL
jgi:hypothetical protein